jgi:hypothetical protein
MTPSCHVEATPDDFQGPWQSGGDRRKDSGVAYKLHEDAMNLATFRQSLVAPAPPAGLGLALEALWHDARGDFDRAHDLAQRDEGGAGDWVHAYLHRKEGDSGNAAYWYRRARKPVCRDSLDAEWGAIAEALLTPEAKT